MMSFPEMRISCLEQGRVQPVHGSLVERSVYLQRRVLRCNFLQQASEAVLLRLVGGRSVTLSAWSQKPKRK